MPSDEENRKQDALQIIEFCSRCRMNDPAIAGKLLAMLEKSSRLSGNLGTDFRNRLADIQSGQLSGAEKCILCRKNPAEDGVACSACVSTYSQGQKTIFEAKSIPKPKEKVPQAGPLATSPKTSGRKMVPNVPRIRNTAIIVGTVLLVALATIVILNFNRFSFGLHSGETDTAENPTMKETSAETAENVAGNDGSTEFAGTAGEDGNSADYAEDTTKEEENPEETTPANPYEERTYAQDNNGYEMDFSNHAVTGEKFASCYETVLKEQCGRYAGAGDGEIRVADKAQTDYRTWYSIVIDGVSGEDLYTECDTAGYVAGVTIIGASDEDRNLWLMASLIVGLDGSLDYDAAYSLVLEAREEGAVVHGSLSFSYYVYSGVPMFSVRYL